MVEYVCAQPTASGEFESNTPNKINNYLCSGTVNLSPTVTYGCPPWTGILTDVAIDGIWYNNQEVKLTLKTPNYDLYETDYITHTVPYPTLTYVPANGTRDEGYRVITPYYSGFDFKVYVLACATKDTFRIYYRVNNVKSNDGSEVFGDSLIDYGYPLACPSGVWANCAVGFGSGPCSCPIIQSGILKYA